MTIKYLFGIAVASTFLLLGGIGLATDVNLNVSAFADADLSTKLFIGAITVGGALSGLFAAPTWSINRTASVMLWIGCIAAFVFSFAISVERIGMSKDGRVQSEVATNARYERAQALVADLTAQRNAEAANGGCGRKCRQWQSKLETAQAELAAIGAPVPIAQDTVRLAALTAGLVTAKQIDMYRPSLGAFGLSIIYNAFLIAAGSLFGGLVKSQAPTVTIAPPRPVKQLTREKQVEMVIADFIRDNKGEVPTFTDVQTITGLPASTVSTYRQKALRKLTA